jgi:hypothetical protein
MVGRKAFQLFQLIDNGIVGRRKDQLNLVRTGFELTECVINGLPDV